MTIAIDFDGTIKRSSQFDSRECKMWQLFINTFRMAGNRPIICTMREESQEALREIGEYNLGIDVYFCGGFSDKRTAMRHFCISVDIWIDDMPDTIGSLPIIGAKP